MFTAPFLIGLAGSLHCIGMCGPLAAALSGGKNLVYNVGRIVTYSLLGALVSFVGMGLSFAGVQQFVSIAVGAGILFVAVSRMRFGVPSFLLKTIIFVRTHFRLNALFSGMVNGILPCGMTFVALGYCVTLNGPLEGSVAMMLFGLGTLPAMLGFQYISKPLVRRLPNVQTVLMILAGLILIGRGVIEVHSHAADHEIVVCGTVPN